MAVCAACKFVVLHLPPVGPVLPHQYLLDRFLADAAVLRQRAVTLRSGPPQPGPDAAMSQRMATACDDVVAMLEAIPDSDDVGALIDSLTALVPLLEQRAAAVTNAPPLRAVYAGAATRIREVATAESRHLADDKQAEVDMLDDSDEDIDDEMDDDIDADDLAADDDK